MGDSGPVTAVGLLVAALAGSLVGWFLRKLGEDARHRAVDAHSREVVKAAECARDRVRAEAHELQSRLDRLRKEHERCGAEIRSLGVRLATTKSSERGSSQDLEPLRRTVADLGARLEDREAGLVSLQSVLGEKDTIITRLEDERRSARSRLAELQQSLEDRSAALTRLTVDLAQARNAHAGCEGRIRELEGRSGKADETGRAISEAHSVTVESLRKELTESRAAQAAGEKRIGELRQRVEELVRSIRDPDPASTAGEPDWLLEVPTREKDNLRAIRGIGPVLERSLNRVGIYSYRQLARLTPENEIWLAPRINTTPERIRRERWASQAKLLASL